MNTTDSSTRFFPGKRQAEALQLRAAWVFVLVFALFFAFGLSLPASAQAPAAPSPAEPSPAATQSSDFPPAQSVRVSEVGPPSLDLVLDRAADGVYLTARLGLELTPALQDVLFKGIPLHFVWSANTIQSRWYWTDRRVSEAVRTIRLAYQPLTRRWRVSYSVGGADGGDLQQALHQNLDTLAEALAASSRVLRWRIADAARLDAGTDYRVEFRYQLDLSLLPRPFQIGVANQSEWNILLQQNLPLPPAP